MNNSLDKNTENFAFVLLISCVATIGGFLFGFDSGVINGTVGGLRVAFNSDDMGTGFNVASMLLGCAIGAAAAGRLADFYGRRSMLIVSAVLFIISAWGSGIASDSIEFIIYRIIGGLAVGAASVMAPAYISEVAPAVYRGRLSSIQQVAIISGLTAAFLSNYLLADISGSSLNILWLGFETWRWMFWVELAPAIIFLVALLFIPESPRFQIAKGNKKDALIVLKKLYGDSDGEIKVSEIVASLASNHHKPSMSDLVNKETNKLQPLVLVGIGLATFQQLIGINVVFYYGAILWQSVGFSENDALLINTVSGLVSIIACIAALLLIDKIGRKPLLLIGSFGMAVTLGLTALAFASSSLDANGSITLVGSMGMLALISANLYVIFFNLSWGPVMWVMLGEMFPYQIRGSGLALAGFFQWFSNFLITISFPILLASIGLAGAYGMYTFFAAISILFVIKYVYETKGVELEEMQNF
ncbi:MAG: sugar porter family MFS transporter [Alteromonadales bacterium]|nr:sugar porter family MFS transporter [Alteromonadales bacterium]